MSARGWVTINLAPISGEPLIAFAYPNGAQREYTAVALLLQENDAQETRTVLGFRDGAHVVTADQIPGFRGVTEESSAGLFSAVADARHRDRRI